MKTEILPHVQRKTSNNYEYKYTYLTVLKIVDKIGGILYLGKFCVKTIVFAWKCQIMPKQCMAAGCNFESCIITHIP